MAPEARHPETGWLGLPDYDMSQAELSHPRHEIDSRGQKKIESTQVYAQITDRHRDRKARDAFATRSVVTI